MLTSLTRAESGAKINSKIEAKVAWVILSQVDKKRPRFIAAIPEIKYCGNNHNAY